MVINEILKFKIGNLRSCSHSGVKKQLFNIFNNFFVLLNQQGMSSTPWLAIESLTDGLYTTKNDV